MLIIIFEKREFYFYLFILRCKNESVKITSVLNVIVAFTTFRLYHNHSTKLDLCLNGLAVSYRQLRPSTVIDPFQLGYSAGPLMVPFPNELTDPNDDSEVRTKFWPQARKQSADLDDRVRTDFSKFMRVGLAKLEDFNGLYFHSSISNIGLVDLGAYECFKDKDFQVENMFTSASCLESMDTNLGIVFFSTVGSNMCCTFNYNSFYVDPKLVDEFIRIFHQILYLVIQ